MSPHMLLIDTYLLTQSRPIIEQTITWNRLHSTPFSREPSQDTYTYTLPKPLTGQQ